ncbi:DUF1919 domain-containing protein [Streptococcus hongkongensis]|nr:acetyltransferase [Streptococcus uberis]
MHYSIKEYIRKKILRFAIKFIYPIKFKSERQNLKNRTFSIISDNCWGARVYQELGLPYNTPFVDLFIFSNDYIKLVSRLRYYMNSELRFISESKYNGKQNYPIGILDDVEIHFQHYKDKEDARRKWSKRVRRINYNNLFFKMNDSDGATIELMEQFDKLNYKNKVIFTAKKYDSLTSSIIFYKCQRENYIKNGKDMKYYRNYFNVEFWLNEVNQIDEGKR